MSDPFARYDLWLQAPYDRPENEVGDCDGCYLLSVPICELGRCQKCHDEDCMHDHEDPGYPHAPDPDDAYDRAREA